MGEVRAPSLDWRPHRVRDVLAVTATSIMLIRYFLERAKYGTNSVSNATNVPDSWTPGLLVMGLTKKSTVTLATESSSVSKVTDLDREALPFSVEMLWKVLNQYQPQQNLLILHLSRRMETAQAAPDVAGCPRCGGKVFHAEQMFSRTQTYHKKCFSCANCKRPLDSVLACDGPDKEIYCRGCYGKKFGAKGYGFAGGAGGLQTGDFEASVSDRPTLVHDYKAIKGEEEDKETCPRCGGKVFHAERMLSKNHSFHKPCFTCLECQRPLDSMTCCDSPDGEIFCKACYGKNFGPHGYGFGGAGSVPALMAAGPGQFEEPRSLIDFHPGTSDGEVPVEDDSGCKRCGFKVFDAEKLMAAGRNWHKRCFSCAACNKHLDSTTVNDGPDGEIYCRSCHSGQFGLTGYGYGQGAGTLLSDGHSTRNAPIISETAFILP